MKTISDHAHAAKLIKQELKKAYPFTAFSVKSSSYSMGDSVRIDYQDGPVYSDVMAIVRKYQYGNFDGMNDIYENTNCRADIPQTKYVLVQRSRSESITKQLIEEVRERYAGCENISIDNYYNTRIGVDGPWASSAINELFSKTAF